MSGVIEVIGALWRRTLDNQIRAQDTHGRNANTGFRGSVCGPETGEDNGGGTAHRAKEGLFDLCQSNPEH